LHSRKKKKDKTNRVTSNSLVFYLEEEKLKQQKGKRRKKTIECKPTPVRSSVCFIIVVIIPRDRKFSFCFITLERQGMLLGFFVFWKIS
jgi:hypothetical protein